MKMPIILSKQSLALTASLGLAALGATVQANAACIDAPLQNGSRGGASSGLRFTPAAYRVDDTAGSFVRVGDWHEENGIVGMWRFRLVAPNGAVVDFGYAQWHSDGTEIQNSGLHAPITSNFCLGVWKQVGPGTYQLNHFPLAWDMTGQSPANAIQLTEKVKLADENHLTGTFTLKVYVWTSTDSLDVAPSMPVATVTGTITATRVTVDSTVPGATE
ncbi:MAG: hypothetical protein WA747_01665 [Steroidobacteraceae bacterium]